LLVEGNSAFDTNVPLLMHLTKRYGESCLEHEIQFRTSEAMALASTRVPLLNCCEVVRQLTPQRNTVEPWVPWRNVF
jgi:hypothetical protein